MDPIQLPAGATAGLYFLPEQGVFLYHNSRGTFKTLNPQAVASAFRDVDFDFDSGYLPARIIRVGMYHGRNFWIAAQPAQMRAITILGQETFNVPTPPMLLFNIGGEYSLWAFKSNKAVDSDTILYHAPFPNIYQNGKICWGSNQLQDLPAQKAAQIFDLFFDSPFNTHLANGKSHANPEDVTRTLKALAWKKKYNLDDLVRAGEVGYLVRVSNHA